MIKHPLITPLIMVCNDEYWLPYCLEASRGFFERYVIYDIGSSDGSKDVIRWFVDSMKGQAEFFVRSYDEVLAPKVQGALRNSMIAEARSEWYFILDADEIYTPDSFEYLNDGVQGAQLTFHEYGQLYGVVRRIEIAKDLASAYGQDRKVPHHRVYHRTAVWTGNHPGEVPLYSQKIQNERSYDMTCYHFHNAARSTKDKLVPKRIERRERGTYRPGEATSFDLFDRLPILKRRIEDFPVNPVLEQMQDGAM